MAKAIEWVAGTASINRPSNADQDEKPSIRLRLRVGDKRILVEMSAEDFALAITGLSEIPVRVEGL